MRLGRRFGVRRRRRKIADGRRARVGRYPPIAVASDRQRFEEYLGSVVGDLNSRRGEVSDVEISGDLRIVRGLVPIAEMFAYSSALRGATQGRGSYAMELAEYRDVPAGIAAKLRED